MYIRVVEGSFLALENIGVLPAEHELNDILIEPAGRVTIQPRRDGTVPIQPPRERRSMSETTLFSSIATAE